MISWRIPGAQPPRDLVEGLARIDRETAARVDEYLVAGLPPARARLNAMEHCRLEREWVVGAMAAWHATLPHPVMILTYAEAAERGISVPKTQG